MSESGKAVFLSYASQDAEAVHRLAEALRASGVDVWFDQNELVGGDAWDAKIRGQIAACALFVPIISANTQARLEGYFRIEWKLAARRTHAMATAKAFLLPIVIDGTRDAEAHVPDEFREVQWTHLPAGQASDKFCARVQALLGGSSGGSPATPTDAGQRHVLLAKRHTRRPAIIGLGLAAIVVAVALAVWRPWRSSTAGLEIGDKSIAVLPFENQSDDPSRMAFFANGVHEDILNHLSNVRELRVIPRQSVLDYQRTKKRAPEIGRELRTAYIVVGSVRRVEDTVRVSAQLIDARTDRQVWSSQSFDRKVTDIFAIQTEIAQAIAGALRAALSPQEMTLLSARPTENLAAYELVLRARELRERRGAQDQTLEELRLLKKAVELDPSYALAHAELATVHAFSYFAWEGTQAHRLEAQRMIEIATRLAPDSPEIVRAMGDYHYWCFRDYARATNYYERFHQLRPNDTSYYNRVASMQRRRGLYAESLVTFRRLEELDPLNSRNLRDITILLAAGRRFEEAIEQHRRAIACKPEDFELRYELAYLHYLWKGSMQEMEDFFVGLPPREANSAQGLKLRRRWALRSGKVEEVISRFAGTAPEGGLKNLTLQGVEPTADVAIALLLAARKEEARLRLGVRQAELNLRLQTNEQDPDGRAELGLVEALLDNSDKALDHAQRAVRERPDSADALDGSTLRAWRALTYTWAGRKEEAIAEYASLLSVPFGSLGGNGGNIIDASVHTMKHDVRFAPLRGNPRFEALLNDPKNRAPLF